MNDLQAQLEEVSKEKQELQEKVRSQAGVGAPQHPGCCPQSRAGWGEQDSGSDAAYPQLQGLQSQLEFLEQSMVDKSLVSRQEAKIRELETRLEFERTQVKRLEVGTAISLTDPSPIPTEVSRCGDHHHPWAPHTAQFRSRGC